MSVQLFAAIVCVLFASCYLARRLIRTLRPGKPGCGGGCGCADTSGKRDETKGSVVVIPLTELKLRRRPPA